MLSQEPKQFLFKNPQNFHLQIALDILSLYNHCKDLVSRILIRIIPVRGLSQSRQFKQLLRGVLQ